jgi:1-acyl-sn-glycerol-3-phosphate acyltransferase
MRNVPNLIVLCIFVIVLCVPLPHATGGELIQPTRTLKSAEKVPGELSVFSEPSGLDVFLNHSKIGTSPILSIKVTPGTYSLKVGDSKTQIHVMPGEPLRLSLFKGTFIKIKEKEKERIQKPETEDRGKRSVESTRKERSYQPEYDPGYWPLTPNGPIK